MLPTSLSACTAVNQELPFPYQKDVPIRALHPRRREQVQLGQRALGRQVSALTQGPGFHLALWPPVIPSSLRNRPHSSSLVAVLISLHTPRMSTWRRPSNSGSRNGAQERVATACSAWGVRTGPCRQADRQIDRRPWDPRLCFLPAVWSSSSVTCWDPCLLTSGLGWCWRLPVCEHRPLPPSLEAVPLLSGL